MTTPSPQSPPGLEEMRRVAERLAEDRESSASYWQSVKNSRGGRLDKDAARALRDAQALRTLADRSDRLSQAEAALTAKDEALRHAALQFEDYARQHRAKGTSEGDAKAATNDGMAFICRRAITQEPDHAE